MTADALGVPGARDWCPIVSDLLGFKAAARDHAAAASDAGATGHALGHADHAAAMAVMANNAGAPDDFSDHDDHHAGVHECPACMSKFAVLTDAPESEYALIRIALAHAYATRQALATHEGETGPPLGSRAPPSRLS